MKPSRAALVAATALLCLAFLACLAQADTLVSAGKLISVKRAFPQAQDDHLVPLLSALPPLGVKCVQEGPRLILTTARSNKVVLELGKTEAWVNGEKQSLPEPPAKIGKEIWLPAATVCSFLGLNARWQEETRTLSINPWLREISVGQTSTAIQITITGTAPLHFKTDQLSDPIRLFLDFANTDLAGGERAVTINKGNVIGLRAKQNSLSPDVVRVVIDLLAWKHYETQIGNNGCTLRLIFPLDAKDMKPILPPTLPQPRPQIATNQTPPLPTPRIPQNQPSVPTGGPVALASIGMLHFSPQLEEVIFSLSAPAKWRWLPGSVNTELKFELASCTSRLPSPRLAPTESALVTDVSVLPVAGRTDALEVTVQLKQALPHKIIAGPKGLRLLLGEAKLSDVSFVVDPGHGGLDPGAVSPQGLTEKEANLDMGLKLADLLRGAGATVAMTREDDKTFFPRRPGDNRDNYQRAHYANSIGADVFLAIHCNSSDDRRRSGTETYYLKADSRELAQDLQEETSLALGLKNGGALRHPKPIIVLHAPKMPSALVEVAYICNATECRLLDRPEFRQQAAQGIFNGLQRYVIEGDILPWFAAKLQKEAAPVEMKDEGKAEEAKSE